MDDINDEMLLREVRRSLMRKIQKESEGGGAASVINNVYGGGLSSGGGNMRGVMDAMASGGGSDGGQHGMEPDDGAYDYFVDINKKDNISDSGEKLGWDKSVHRYRKKKMISDNQG